MKMSKNLDVPLVLSEREIKMLVEATGQAKRCLGRRVVVSEKIPLAGKVRQ